MWLVAELSGDLANRQREWSLSSPFAATRLDADRRSVPSESAADLELQPPASSLTRSWYAISIKLGQSSLVNQAQHVAGGYPQLLAMRDDSGKDGVASA